MKYYFALIIMTYHCIGCSNRQADVVKIYNEERGVYINNVADSSRNIKEFALDHQTTNIVDYLKFIDHDTISYLSILNEYNNSIYFYDNEGLAFIRKIKIDNDRIGKVQGYEYINDDSIFVYSYSKGFIFGINCKSEIFYEYKISKLPNKNDNKIYPYTFCMTTSPIIKKDNYLISVGFLGGETLNETTDNRPICSVLNLINGSQQFLVNYPAMYSDHNWGGGFEYRMPYYDISEDDIIISFSASHHIVKISHMTGNQSSHYAGSSVVEAIEPFPYIKGNSDRLLLRSWYMGNPSYEGIFYDKYNNHYYRMARLPNKKYIKGDRDNNKPTVVIVLDSTLNYIGEVNLPADILFNPSCSYVSKDGLNIQVKTDNEDKLVFYQYKIIFK